VGTAVSAVRSSKARQCVRTIVADLPFVNPQTNSRPAQQPSGGRQPLLWAALAFAAGIATGVYTWRPPLWWAAAFVVIAASGVFLSRRRWRSAFLLGMGTSFVLGAFIISSVRSE
jgi:lysozyme family protein